MKAEAKYQEKRQRNGRWLFPVGTSGTFSFHKLEPSDRYKHQRNFRAKRYTYTELDIRHQHLVIS